MNKLCSIKTAFCIFFLIALVSFKVPLQAQSCECEDYMYLNDIADHTNGFVHKMRIESDGSFTEIDGDLTTAGIQPWLPPGAGLPSPHGLGWDLNGYLYIGETASGNITKLDCDGNIIQDDFILDSGWNITSKDGILFVNPNGTDQIRSYDLCTGDPIGYVVLSGAEDGDLSDWGFQIGADGIFYASSGFLEYDCSKPSYIYKFEPTEADFLANTVYTPFITDADFPAGVSGCNDIWAVTADAASNVYLTLIDYESGFTNPWEQWILKFDIDGNLVDSDSEGENVDPNGAGTPGLGYYGSRGMIYYAPFDVLYLAGGPDGDCVAILDAATLDYIGPAAENQPGQLPKTLNILTECCPTPGDITIDETFCSASIDEEYFLQEFINCDGIICEGQWVADTENIGIDFNECNNSVTITGSLACGTFTLSSDGTGNNPQCGAFSVTVNIDVLNIVAPVLEAGQTVCDGGDPSSIGITTAASGTGTILYQWQSSTTDCSTGFTDIDGAISATYDPPAGLNATTYYRVITSVVGDCSSGECMDTSNCTTITIDPNCAPCSITAAGEANLACDDNDTGSDGTDDFLTIDLNPTGSEIGASYTVSVSSGTIAPTSGTYGVATSFTITADLTAAEDIVITITDIDDSDCQFPLTITDPSPCSTPDPCSITSAGEANLACDDNDTGSDGTDDFLTLDLNPTGSMIGTLYFVSVSSGTIAPEFALYGSATSFTLTGDLSAAADVEITITDEDDSNCQFILTITDPSPCSTPDPCSITAAGEANLACDDNDTGSDGTDDFLTIDLNPTGTMIGTNYIVSVSSGTIAPTTAAYGSATSFTLTGDLSTAADVVITITDEDDSNCQFILTITDPSPCSTPDPCSITAAGEANLACDDNDTGSDGTDDFLTIDLNPTGTMIGTNYTVSVSSGTIAPTTAAYGSATSFTLTGDLSAAADVVITITDEDDSNCQFVLTITDPSPCSTPDPCSITAAGEANLVCDDNDTGSDGTDDFLTIDLNPTGTMIGTNYTVSVSSGTIAPTTAAYGSATSFTLTGDLSTAADVVITITDEDDSNCQFILTITDPSPCSTPDPCSITAAGEANLACDDNDTGSDGTDDFLTIDLNPTGTMIGTNYTVSVSSGTIAPTTAAYGSATSFTLTGDLSTTADVVITITDEDDSNCQFVLTITDPSPCSTPDPCTITAAGEANLACDDNDTGSDGTDDFLTIDLNPTGTMIGTNYTVSVSSGTIAPTTAAYGSATSFTLTGDLSIAADVVITITDEDDSNCQFVLTITDPSPCSSPSCLVNSVDASMIVCDDNSTEVETDDFYTMDITVNYSGNSAGDGGLIVNGGASIATTGSPQVISIQLPADGTSPTISVVFENNAACSGSVEVGPLDPCSSTCPPNVYEMCDGESYSLQVDPGSVNIQWYLDGNPIDAADGGNSETLIATMAGVYHYIADDLDGCSGELCCPITISIVPCCPEPQCFSGTFIKN